MSYSSVYYAVPDYYNAWRLQTVNKTWKTFGQLTYEKQKVFKISEAGTVVSSTIKGLPSCRVWEIWLTHNTIKKRQQKYSIQDAEIYWSIVSLEGWFSHLHFNNHVPSHCTKWLSIHSIGQELVKKPQPNCVGKGPAPFSHSLAQFSVPSFLWNATSTFDRVDQNYR